MSGKRTRQPGQLETDVMRVLWNSSERVTASQIREAIDAPHPALTTTLTVLERLRAKGLVERIDTPLSPILFSATVSETSHAAKAMELVLEQSSNRDAALLRFAGGLSEHEISLLRNALTAEMPTE
jgi:predicted transcriptional regulator